MTTKPLPRLALAAVMAACGAAAHAQGQATLHFAEGRISVSATEVPMRTLLEDWARLGQTRIVNLDRVATTPVSIILDNVPEAEALEIILRSAAGYMAAPRAVRIAGASTFDRILVMPPGSGPVATADAGGAGRGGAAGGSGRQRRGRGTGAPTGDAVPMPDTATTDAESPFGQPGDSPFQTNPFMNAGQPPALGQPAENPFRPLPFGNIEQPPPFGQPTLFGTPVLPGPTPPPLFGPVDGAGAATSPTPNPFLRLTPSQPSGTPPAPAAGPSNGFGGATVPGVVMPTTPPPAGTPGRPPVGA